ncbi:MAG: hypothetical protein WB661_09450 [Candidatus Bathyarchaeia archaeon]
MPKKVINGMINGVNVKVIFTSDQWFAKPNNHLTNGRCLNCPHFQDYDGILEVHEDSMDGLQYRAMIHPDTIASGSYSSGNTWVSNRGKDLAVLPMGTSANGFRLETTASGSNLTLSNESWCLMAMGKWGDWKPKAPKPQ